MLCFFVKDGVKVNQHVYLDMLKNRVLPWINSLPGNQAVTLQQDGATSHTAKMFQVWCKDNFKSFWSKNSGPLLLLILIRWTLGYDPSWRERPALCHI